MPFIRVRVRHKDGVPDSDLEGGPGTLEVGTGRSTPAPSGRQHTPETGQPKQASGTSAFVAGALVALFALAVISATVLVRRAGGSDAQGAGDSPSDSVQPAVTAAAGAAVGPTAEGGQSTAPAAAGNPSTAPTPASLAPAAFVDTRTGPSPINPEFNLEDPIAYVNDSVIAMRDLDRSVRIARVLGELSGDPIPANDAPEFRDFQIRMLKRLVDLELMAQGALDAGLPIPEGATTPVVDGFLQEVGATRDELDAAMARQAVSSEELHKWFSDARTAQYFVTESLATDTGDDPAAAEQLTQEWLKNAWATKTILINFYEPE